MAGVQAELDLNDDLAAAAAVIGGQVCGQRKNHGLKKRNESRYDFIKQKRLFHN